MKHENFGMNIMYGILGAIMLIVGVACVIIGILNPGNLSLAIIGGIFVIIGGILTYFGIKSFLHLRKMIAEKKAQEEFEKNNPKPVPKPNLCPNCGIEFSKTDEFCRKCGAKLK